MFKNFTGIMHLCSVHIHIHKYMLIYMNACKLYEYMDIIDWMYNLNNQIVSELFLVGNS